MISHFNYQSIKNNIINREWRFTFYYKQDKYTGTYFKDGSIEWISHRSIQESDKKFLEKCVHDLMLYHVYEDH